VHFAPDQENTMFASLFTTGRRLGQRLACVATVTLLTLPTFARADQAEPTDKTESPYFAVNSTDPNTDRLPLKNTHVDVRIMGVIADVTVTQEYRNEGKAALEARYVFPGSTRAAVYAMNVRLGERLLSAKIKEKQQAKVEYEQAKSEGKTAALLEQQRPNVFQMNVANIMPGDDVRVEMHYTELMVPTDGRYQFVFPTVVGPRYNGQAGTESSKNEKWVSTPYLHAGEQAPAAFDMKLKLVTPTGIADVSSPSHHIEVQQDNAQESTVKLAATGRNENNRDFILDYRLAGDKIQSGILLSQGDKENFFLAMVEPPKAVDTSIIVPREYVFVVDVSGSMHGFPLDTTKALMNRLFSGLRPSDTFNLMTFSGGNTRLAPQSLPATRANIDLALRTLDREEGGGSTEMLPALKRALKLPGDAERSRTFIVVTDGYVTVEDEAFALVAKNLDHANLFAFGIGSSVNRQLMEGLARAGQGEPFIVENQAAADREAERFRKMINAPVLTHIKAHFEGFDAYDVEPVAVPDVFANRPVILFGKWRGSAQGKLVLQGHSATGEYTAELPIHASASDRDNSALGYLWARHRIASLTDLENLTSSHDQRDEILRLGLDYHLLTQYTSFIAVDQVVRNKGAAASTVDEPSPLPQGVEDSAIGAEVPSTPEPATWAMLLIAGLIMLAAFTKQKHKTR
jgi:Ca-activated chloride channel family protein